MARVVHVTTVHPRMDNRIMRRECSSLRDSGNDVHLVVADGVGNDVVDGITVSDIDRAKSRLERMIKLPFRAMAAAWALQPAVIHFHDPELLPAAVWMRIRGAKVVYDAHEDLPRSIMSKEWINIGIRRVVSMIAELVENFCANRMSAIVAATPIIADRFKGGKPIVETVCNYPDLSQAPVPMREHAEPATFVYVGALSVHRGLKEMVEAVHIADARLIIAGPFETPEQQAEISAMPGWTNVEYLGVIPHADVWTVLQRARAGLLFLHPVRNYIDSLPTKMYEYMAIELPVLGSDYVGWPDTIKENDIGLTCDPLDPQAIAALMRRIIDDPEAAEAMGQRGREVVMAKYRWENEAAKLVALYDRLLPAAT